MPERFTRRDALACGALALVLLACASARIYVGVCGQSHDDGIYVITARALAEGEGYRITSLPGSPPQTKYPILYPAVLAALWTAWPAFPDNLLLLQGFSLVCGMALVSLTYLYLVRFGYAGRPVAFAACLLCATSVSFVYFATVTMSEMLFGVLVVAALWRLDAVRLREEVTRGEALLAGVVVALPFLCRSIGVVLVPAALLVLWHRPRAWRGVFLGAGVTALPWVVWAKAAAGQFGSDPVQGYYTDYVGWFTSLGLPSLGRILSVNALCILQGIAGPPADGLSFPLAEYDNGLAVLLFAPPGLLAVAGIVFDFKSGRALPAFLAGYLLLVWVWPWVPQRFLIPVLPALTAYLLGTLACLPGPAAWKGPRPGWAALAALTALNLAWLGHTARELRRLDTPTPEMAGRAGAWSSYRGLFAWIDAHTAPGDVIGTGADPMVSLYTGRRAFYPIVCPPLYLFYAPEDEPEVPLAEALRGVTAYRPRYLATVPNHHGEARYRAWLDRLRRAYPDRVVPVYTGDDPRYAVYELRHPLAGPPEPPTATASR